MLCDMTGASGIWRRSWARGIRTIQIPQGRSQRNCYVERFIRTLRQECLSH
jgi:hypothetical protein